MYINQLKIELMVFSLNLQIGDPRIEFQAERVDENFPKNSDLTAN